MKTLHEIVQESFADQHRKMGLITSRHTAEYLSKNNVVVKRYGQWVKNEWGDPVKICSECGNQPNAQPGKFNEPCYSKHCPSCGAEMRGAHD